MPTPETIHDHRRPLPAPVEYAGQWVAWDRARRLIVAHGIALSDVEAAAAAAGYADAVLQKVRRPETVFIGAT